MANPLTVVNMTFPSQKAAEKFFYQIRDDNWSSKAIILEGQSFKLLCTLYEEYCRCTNWPLTGRPISFRAKHIGRQGGTTVGFGVKFDNGTEVEFSVRKAIQAIASQYG